MADDTRITYDRWMGYYLNDSQLNTVSCITSIVNHQLVFNMALARLNLIYTLQPVQATSTPDSKLKPISVCMTHLKLALFQHNGSTARS